MHSCSPAGGGCRASASCSSSMNHHHKRVAFRGPLSLLWLALLAVATGPAACFVVLPSSTCLRGAGFFAAASPLPKVVLGSRQGSCGARHSSGSGGGGRDQRRVFSRARRGEDLAREEQQQQEEEEEETEHKDEEDTHGGRQNALPKARSHSLLASSTGIRNARAFRAVTALSEGKGFRAAASVLRASVTGVELDSRVAQTDSRPKRVLILMSDTGGGHRASSQALTAALEDLYGDQIHTDTVDIWTDYGRFPFDTPVKMYKFLGKHPILWKLSYDMARFPLTRRGAEIMANLTCHKSFRECMEKYKPDLVVSTHPLCHHVPLKVLKRLRQESGKEIPFATVVTDLGSGHPTWFDPRGDLVYVPSDVLRQRAQERGISKDKLLQFGLPVRNAFWEQSADKQAVQKKLGLKAGVRTALIVGGGDGVGKLVDIAKNVADRLASDHHPGQVVVVCGTNERIKEALDGHSWPGEGSGVTVRVLGFVANMDEWMTASDLLVTKAGPGTIAEACTRGLPVIISSFLPGQEAGNVPYVTENDFGLYRKNPVEIAHEVSDLLADRQRLEQMGENARSMGRPHATLDIARSLVSTMLPGTKELHKPSSSSSSSASSPSPSSPPPPSFSV